MIFLMALRNIVRNRKNSIVVVLLIAVITALFFIGNSLITSSNMGLEQSFVDSMTGDVIIETKTDVTMSLYGANVPIMDSYITIPVLTAHNAIMDVLKNVEGIESVTSQVSGSAYLDVLGVREPAVLCGVDPATYFAQFPGLIIEEGSVLQDGEYGAMITRERAERIEKESGTAPEIGTALMFTSAGAAGFKIREVPLKGIFSYTTKGRFTNEIIIADPQTVRVLSAIQIAASDVKLDSQKTNLLDESIIDDDIFFGGADNDADNETDLIQTVSLSDGIDDLTDTSESTTKVVQSDISADTSGGDWNFILIRLAHNADKSKTIAKINNLVLSYGAAAYGWRIAAGTSAILVLLLQMLFNAGVFLVSVAGIIAVINILLIAVFRRTREIGTLRAIGASGGYIRTLILSENIMLALAAGISGVVLGYLVLLFVNNLSININNELLADLFGGKILNVRFVPSVAFISVILAELLSILASIYPTEMAVRIEPIVAVRQG